MTTEQVISFDRFRGFVFALFGWLRTKQNTSRFLLSIQPRMVQSFTRSELSPSDLWMKLFDPNFATQGNLWQERDVALAAQVFRKTMWLSQKYQEDQLDFSSPKMWLDVEVINHQTQQFIEKNLDS